MLLAAIAFLIAAGGLVFGRLNLSQGAKRRAGLVVAASFAAALAFSALRLPPLALLAILVGTGYIANIAVRDRGDRQERGDEEQARAAPPPRGGGAMTRGEALAVLGLDGNPDATAINAAHRRMIVRAHPDQGGSDYMAAKVNEARGILLGKD
jgi:hypothetical protein